MIPVPVFVWLLAIHFESGTLVYSEHPFTEAECREKSREWNQQVVLRDKGKMDIAFCKPLRVSR
jgi:hypothetical protein